MLNSDHPVAILGASKGPGLLLFRQLRDAGLQVVGIARTRPQEPRSDNASFIKLDARNTEALRDAIPADARYVHASRPEFLTELLKLAPDLSRIVALGSTRIYTKFPDDKCERVTAMAHAISMQNIPATLLHPTMIYGAPGLNNIERIVRYARLLPFVPLPDGGKALIQPVHADDVVRAMIASLSSEEAIGRTIVVPGAKATTYREFVELCIQSAEAQCKVISLPYSLLRVGAAMTSLLPFLPSITQEEIQRLNEDKDFDTDDLRTLLGIEPLALEQGIRAALG